ncbi:MAG: aminomethyl-transferring glycine dehydrogenase subunit GcvPA [Candidatus Lokiarchaeota archaeon]
MKFVPHDKETILEMLSKIGVESIDDLFSDIPKDLRTKKLNLPDALNEPDLLNRMKKISQKHRTYETSYLGAGSYFHYIPSSVDYVTSRSEFYTSYTPYQAEASQGFLQAIYEYQTVIVQLTKMDVANASMYDGSTALAEAALMSTAITRKNKVLLLKGIHPEYIEVVKTYCWGHEIGIEIIEERQLEDKLDNKVAAVLFQSPNFFGDIEDVGELTKKIKEISPKCLIVQCMTDPTCLGVIKPPGDNDIDIFVAEGQAFGINPSFGGPSLGIFTTKEKYLRKIPGRLVGKTKEIDGIKDGFILTLQAREQHIRREKATSNICTNQALCMLAALIYLLSMGQYGLKQIAYQNLQKTNFLKKKLSKIENYEILNTKPTYNEFLVKCPNLKLLLNKCNEQGILPPLDTSKYYPEMKDIALICVTELNSKSDLDSFLKIAKECVINK